ncbi:hypothetical protein [Paenibacillus polymyxa]|uniref:hypothetical protein n=1 Tax=Paenibacillus polymyxa TaxID=1406 RepID=UPI00222305BD|nr:hypothetical protein [Paenibacillus polymyxa]
MIQWFECIVIQPPGEGKYMVSDGNTAEAAYYQLYDSTVNPVEYRWYTPDMSPIESEEITHWAFINLPGEA